MADLQLDRIEARLRTLTILQQRMRLQVERMADEMGRLAREFDTRSPFGRNDGPGTNGG